MFRALVIVVKCSVSVLSKLSGETVIEMNGDTSYTNQTHLVVFAAAGVIVVS